METNQECQSCKHGGQCGIETAYKALHDIKRYSNFAELPFSVRFEIMTALALRDPICHGYQQCKEDE